METECPATSKVGGGGSHTHTQSRCRSENMQVNTRANTPSLRAIYLQTPLTVPASIPASASPHHNQSCLFATLTHSTLCITWTRGNNHFTPLISLLTIQPLPQPSISLCSLFVHLCFMHVDVEDGGGGCPEPCGRILGVHLFLVSFKPVLGKGVALLAQRQDPGERRRCVGGEG